MTLKEKLRLLAWDYGLTLHDKAYGKDGEVIVCNEFNDEVEIIDASSVEEAADKLLARKEGAK